MQLTMKQRLHPIPMMTPFVTNSPLTLLVVHPLNTCPIPNNEHANNAAFLVPSRRISRVLIIAANEIKATEVDPMKASVESGARCSDASFAWMIPHEYVRPT
jgi:hypothetical protein